MTSEKENQIELGREYFPGLKDVTLKANLHYTLVHPLHQRLSAAIPVISMALYSLIAEEYTNLDKQS